MYKHLLVPTDGSELSLAAVQQASQLASALDARVTVLYVQPSSPVPKGAEAFVMAPYAEEFERRSAAAINDIFAQTTDEFARAKVKSKCVTAPSDDPWEVIINTAKMEECDLIVMASHGRKGIAGLLIGSQTQKVLTHCKIPVLVCR